MCRSKPSQRFSRPAGFTLAEILLVTMLIGVLTLSLYHALSGGIRVWERSQVLSVDEDVMLFLDRLTMDLRNTFEFSLFEFEAEPDRVVFSTIVSVPMGRSGAGPVIAYADQIGKVEYGFDSRMKAVYRRQAHYGQAVEGVFGEKKILARKISRMGFAYFERGEMGVSEKKVDRQALPAVIEVSLEYYDVRGRSQKVTRMINVPLFL